MSARSLVAVCTTAATVGIEDVKGFYTWRTWTFGWLTRVVFQVLFFAMVGNYLGSADVTAFILVGSSAAIAVLEVMTIVMYGAFDRQFGLLPLLVSSPGNYHVMFMARNSNCVVTGSATASIALVICSLILGTPLSWTILLVVPLLLLGALSTYCFGGFLAAVVAKAVHGRWLAFNVGYLTLTALGGFLVPRSFWPAPVEAASTVLPFAHALTAIRGVLQDADATFVLQNVAAEAAIGLAWFAVGALAFRASIGWARRDGSIDLAG